MLIRTIILILFLLCNVFLISQNMLSGTVVDKNAGKPLADVIVQYGNTSKEYVITDANGRFSIPGNAQDILHFQTIGYNSVSVIKSAINNNTVIYMELSPITLSPVLISPDDADRLLADAMKNTKKNLLLNRPVGYLLHFIRSKNTDTLRNEIFMEYATTLKESQLKKSIKKEKVPYKYNLINIAHIEKAPISTTEIFGAEYHASHLFSFGDSYKNRTTKSYTEDSSLIIMRIEPLDGKNGWAKGEICIDNKDMTIVSMEISSVDSVLENESFKKYIDRKVKTVRKIGRLKFEKVKGRYYMKDCFTYYRFKSKNDLGEEDISYYCDVNFIGFAEKDQFRKRPVSGFCQELFYIPNSTSRNFWTGDPGERYDTDGSTLSEKEIRGNRSAAKQKIKKYSNYWPVVALIGIAMVLAN